MVRNQELIHCYRRALFRFSRGNQVVGGGGGGGSGDMKRPIPILRVIFLVARL